MIAALALYVLMVNWSDGTGWHELAGAGYVFESLEECVFNADNPPTPRHSRPRGVYRCDIFFDDENVD